LKVESRNARVLASGMSECYKRYLRHSPWGITTLHFRLVNADASIV
jgi:hypothetical protein